MRSGGARARGGVRPVRGHEHARAAQPGAQLRRPARQRRQRLRLSRAAPSLQARCRPAGRATGSRCCHWQARRRSLLRPWAGHRRGACTKSLQAWRSRLRHLLQLWLM